MKTAREASAWIFAAQKPKDWKVAPIEIDVVYRHSKSSSGYRARDVQNGIAACKSLLDGMVDAGIIPADSAKWLQWGHFELVTQADGTRDGVYITVRAQ